MSLLGPVQAGVAASQGTLTPQQVYALARQAGATPEEAIILTAIAKYESGYRPRAHNPNANTGDNSYGLWQINMLGGMGPQRRSDLGLTSNEQLWDPATNARAAVYVLRRQGFKAWSVYKNNTYRAALPEAEAAARAVGDNFDSVALSAAQVGSTIGGPTTTAAGGGGGATAPPGLPPNASPAQIEQYIRENYPQMAGYLDVPEVRDVLIRAARENWTGTKLQAEIQATTWWRTTASAARQYELLRNTDPAEADAMLQRKIDEIEPEIAQLGITSDVRTIAEAALRNGWTQDQLRENLVGHLRYASEHTGLAEGSTAGVTADELARMARQDYFVPVNRQDVERWAIDIYAGTRTEDQYRAWLARMAEGRFTDAIEGGLSPGEYMAPIRNIIADTLELNPADVDLLDPRWAEVLQYQTDQGTRPMTLSEALSWARSRPEYRFTNNAMGEAANLAEEIGQRFGAVA